MRNVPTLSYYESDAEDDRMSDEDYSPSQERYNVESDTESIYDDNYDSDEEYLPMKFTPLDMVKKSKKVENVVFVMQKDVSKNIIDRTKNGKETILRRSKRFSKKT
jgi:hypothetical protein